MPALPLLGLDIHRCITKTSQKSKMAKMLYVINVMLHENASVKKIKNEQICNSQGQNAKPKIQVNHMG